MIKGLLIGIGILLFISFIARAHIFVEGYKAFRAQGRGRIMSFICSVIFHYIGGIKQ